MELRDTAKADRVLEVASSGRIPELAVGERGAQRLDCPREARVGPRRRNGRIECREIGPERLEVERGGDDEHTQQPVSLVEREASEGGRERVAIQERQPFLRLELVAREDLEHEIGERDDVALPGRAVQPDRGEVLAVEAREDPLDQLRPHACIPTREVVREAEHRCPHDLAVDRRALAAAMVEHERALVRGIRERVDDDALAHADASCEAVDGVAALRDREHHVTASRHPFPSVRRESSRATEARDVDHVAQCERPCPDEDRFPRHAARTSRRGGEVR